MVAGRCRNACFDGGDDQIIRSIVAPAEGRFDGISVGIIGCEQREDAFADTC